MLKKLEFGISYPNVDFSQSREGLAEGVFDCYQDDDGSYVKRPGQLRWVTLPQSKPVVALYETKGFSNVILAVCNGVVYKINSDASYTAFTGNTVAADVACTFAEDTSYVYVADGTRLTRLNMTTVSAATMSGGNVPQTGVTHVVSSMGYLLTNGTGGSVGDTFFSRALANNYESADSWQAFNNEALSDSCNGVYVIPGFNEVFCSGQHSIEIVVNDGTTPWAVLSGGFVPYGVHAAQSVAVIGDTLFYLTVIDGSRRVVRLQNRTPEIISLPYDNLINNFTTTNDAKAWGVSVKGRIFYLITFPSGDVTFAYDINAKKWYRWRYMGSGGNTPQRMRFNSYAYSRTMNKGFIGDTSNTGKVFVLEGTTDDSYLIKFQLNSGNVDHGTSVRKRSSKLTIKTKRGSTALVGQLATESYVYSLCSLGNGIIYAGTGSTGLLYKSADYGKTWTKSGRLGSETIIYSLADLGSGVGLAGTYPLGHIYRTTDSGDNWTDIGRLGTETGIRSLVYCGSNVALAGTWTGGNIYRSTDAGLNWSLVGRLGTEDKIYTMLSLGSGRVLAGTDPGGKVYISTDSGATWDSGTALGTVDSVLGFASLGSSIVLAVTADTAGNAIYRSTDNGATWSLAASSLGSQASMLCVASAGGGVVYAGSGGVTAELFVSTDYGVTWTEAEVLNYDAHCLSMVYTGNNTLLLGTSNNARVYVLATTAPTYSLRWRDDGAAYNTAHSLSLGIPGDRELTTRVVGLGSYRNRQYEISHTSTSSHFVLVSVEEDVEARTS